MFIFLSIPIGLVLLVLGIIGIAQDITGRQVLIVAMARVVLIVGSLTVIAASVLFLWLLASL